MIYINKHVNFWEVSEQLPDSYLIGVSPFDFEEGAYILLNEAQVTFYRENPTATPLEVLNQEMLPKDEPHTLTIEETLDSDKRAKIMEITDYGCSSNLNEFFIDTKGCWLDANTRANYKNSVEAAETLGEDTVTFEMSGNIYTIPVTDAKLMLAKIQRYADNCSIATQRHIINVNSLTTNDAVKNYDFTTGYPAKENFDFTNLTSNAN